MGKSAAGPRTMEVSGFAAACKYFAASVAFLHGWNDSGTQGLSKVQSSSGRRFPAPKHSWKQKQECVKLDFL